MKNRRKNSKGKRVKMSNKAAHFHRTRSGRQINLFTVRVSFMWIVDENREIWIFNVSAAYRKGKKYVCKNDQIRFKSRFLWWRWVLFHFLPLCDCWLRELCCCIVGRLSMEIFDSLMRNFMRRKFDLSFPSNFDGKISSHGHCSVDHKWPFLHKNVPNIHF